MEIAKKRSVLIKEFLQLIDETYNEQFAWMGIESVNRGLYIVDGVPLLFLKKERIEFYI